MRKAIAIDFDGCLCTDAFPAIGEPNWPVIKRAQVEQRAGAGLILWTCREGQILQDAIAACEGWGLTFDSINESLPDWIEAFGTQPRKVGATEYWDDKAASIPVAGRFPDLPNAPLTLEELREMDGEPVFIKCLFNDELSSYVVVDKRRDSAGIFTRLFYASFDYYGDEWLAYRCKPEWATRKREDAPK